MSREWDYPEKPMKKIFDLINEITEASAYFVRSELREELLSVLVSEFNDHANFAFVLGLIVGSVATLLITFKQWTIVAVITVIIAIACGWKSFQRSAAKRSE